MESTVEDVQHQLSTHFTHRLRCLQPPRPRLAVNVVAMFRDQRRPVQQMRRGGRYPKSVVCLANERARRYRERLPVFKVGDRVEVQLRKDEWFRAIIVAHLETSNDGMKKFRLLNDGHLFDFGRSLEQYCQAWESALRPA